MSKLVSVEDTLAVQDLLARYCWYVDEGMSEEWAALYTADGIFEGTRPEPVIGTAALKKVPAEIQARAKGGIRHQYGNLYLEYGDAANTLTARFYNQISMWKDGDASLVMMAICTATLVRADAGAPWRIKRNTIRALRASV
jgi:hypothetical protein